ncbi:SDR family oxidoreductase [Streptomyces sp. Inha503]|uniref:SDR family oxidoreductase n=1 Tax=Streptomyces sp. Inha503 TaxID=3383314 RepID=UPI0039A09412
MRHGCDADSGSSPCGAHVRAELPRRPARHRRARDILRQTNLLGREGNAWDLAWAALFMACPESRWITGTVLPVDAGTTAATGLGMLSRLTAPDDGEQP